MSEEKDTKMEEKPLGEGIDPFADEISTASSQRPSIVLGDGDAKYLRYQVL